MIGSTMTYAAETRADTSRIKRMILRMIAGRTRIGRIGNKDIREECAIGDVVKFARERGKQWNDHMQRPEES
ncbi:hypothetical protein Trydic_g10309 [Trypoxylus dichotomus]